MRSTLLFVAVLLACTPMRAQTTAPTGAPILDGWFDTIFTAPAALASRSVNVNRRTPAIRTWASTPSAPARANAAPLLPANSIALLLHDPNAP